MLKKDERYTPQYLKDNFWNGTVDNDIKVDCLEVKKGEQLSLVDNNEICEKSIKYCLYRALKDFTDRTETRKEGVESYGPIKKLEDLYKEGFVNGFVEYFKQEKSQTDFDQWHKGMCEDFLKVVKNNYESDIQYGKAQKIVNMTFKNIYCLQNADKYEEYFKYCHMPLDSIMLEWFYRSGQISEIKIKGERVKRKYPSWSKLEYKNDSDGKYSYAEIQEWIRKYFGLSDKTDIKTQWTPFTAEFVLWKRMQFEFAAEGFYSQLLALGSLSEDKELKGKNDFVKSSVGDKKRYIEKKLERSCFDFINTKI